ncbi:ATP-binding cassette domain-containing protein [Paenibacillus sp. MMS20-IR301]|uniref:ABC transporter ATP-binding protein n=1 Tax=Paenibacillus sp. MMS20-IR301 TaxID=2895946 RepID=UPI0028E3ADC8|nr:ATP-binding cassette domain-containing protein [Paenibacillus sp. MMS20-IR301]WNS41328.1 ATP-binding cassette domain-containing protein [Paenibacillus sp. MMS20-IR301]
MEILQAEHVSFRYPEEDRDSLHELSFTIEEGEFVVLCGPSGCGKTTLLRHLKRELAPVGSFSGTIAYKGQLLPELPASVAAGEIGMVFQNPDAQIVMDTVWHELAFSMENLGMAPAVMRTRLAEICGLFALEPLLYRSVHELSGGQKQLLNLASVLLLQPKVLLLDEPTSQLDPVAAREFIMALQRLNEELGVTVIISEHRLEEVLPLADRVLLLEEGVLQLNASPRDFARQAGGAAAAGRQDYLPAAARLCLSLSQPAAAAVPDNIPLTVREGRRWLHSLKAEAAAGVPGPETAAAPGAPSRNHGRPQAALPAASAETLLSCREVTFRYEKEGQEVLRKLTMTLKRGELLAVMGGNGAGKSTLLHVLSGQMKPQRGKVMSSKGVTTGLLAQNPLLYFSYDTVAEELQHMAQVAGLPAEAAEREIEALLEVFQLREVLQSHPHDLSGGQQQQAALAMIMLLKPDILLLDEPTKGLDPAAKDRLAALLQQLRAQGASLLIVTHDVEFAARHASRCALLFDGSITAEGAPEDFFSANYFYTTAVNRMVRDWLPQALTMEDVIQAWPGSAPRC